MCRHTEAHLGTFPQITYNIPAMLTLNLHSGDNIKKMINKNIYIWIIKEMGRWRYIGRFNTVKQYNKKRKDFILSCPSQLRVLEDEKHFQKTINLMLEPEWDHHQNIKKALSR